MLIKNKQLTDQNASSHWCPSPFFRVFSLSPRVRNRHHHHPPAPLHPGKVPQARWRHRMLLKLQNCKTKILAVISTCCKMSAKCCESILYNAGCSILYCSHDLATWLKCRRIAFWCFAIRNKKIEAANWNKLPPIKLINWITQAIHESRKNRNGRRDCSTAKPVPHSTWKNYQINKQYESRINWRRRMIRECRRPPSSSWRSCSSCPSWWVGRDPRPRRRNSRPPRSPWGRDWVFIK